MSVDEIRRGEFGVVDPEFGDPLSAHEVAILPEGTRVIIIWSGGNGPHEYLAMGHPYGERYAVAPQDVDNERMRFYNPITFVGGERFHTRVWLRDSGGAA